MGCRHGLCVAFFVVIAAGLFAGCGDDGAAPSPDAAVNANDAAVPPDADPWGGRTIDDPFATDQIEQVDTRNASGFTVEYYRNLAYTCGRTGYQTFTILYPEALPLSELRPLWVRMHGGGVGAFDPDGNYVPPGQIGMLDEEGGTGLDYNAYIRDWVTDRLTDPLP